MLYPFKRSNYFVNEIMFREVLILWWICVRKGLRMMKGWSHISVDDMLNEFIHMTARNLTLTFFLNIFLWLNWESDGYQLIMLNKNCLYGTIKFLVKCTKSGYLFLFLCAFQMSYTWAPVKESLIPESISTTLYYL